MNKYQRFWAFANFESVDRVPRHASFVETLQLKMTEHLGKKPDDVYEMDSGTAVGLVPPEDYQTPDYSVYFPEYLENPNFYIDANGCGHLGHGCYHFTEYLSPLKKAQSFEEIEQYPFPDKTNWSDAQMRSVCEEAHAQGEYVTAAIGHMYESSWQVRGYQEFLVDLITQPDWAEYILDRYCENNKAVAAAAGRLGFDCLTTGDDVANQNNMMFSPEVWRRVMKPRWASVYEAARSEKADIQIWYHSDGNIEPILDDLVEIGVTILNPVQPECMDPVKIRKRFGKRLAFDGCIGTQTTFPFGTPAEMQSAVLELAEALDALNGGLMLAPTHVLEPEVPPVNVVAFFDACEQLQR